MAVTLAALLPAAEPTASATPEAAGKALAADNTCSLGSQEGSCAVSALQISSRNAGSSSSSRRKEVAPNAEELVMVHIPCNFGHTIEAVALNPIGLQLGEAFMSFNAETREAQWQHIRRAAGPGAQIWGMMNPDLRIRSEATGCDLYYTPQYFWPRELAARYFGNKTVFGMLRNPYDKIVNEFRMQLMVYSSVFTAETRADVSRREGHLEKEREPYTTWYKTCDVNAWVKAELAKYKTGDKFRGNCHLLPQADFFRGEYGVSLAIGVAEVPLSFNKAMEEHSSPIRMNEEVGHNTLCNVSAWSLDEESVALIQEVYAEDFELNCQRLGTCDTEIKECCCRVPQMCGGAPADYCASRSL